MRIPWEWLELSELRGMYPCAGCGGCGSEWVRVEVDEEECRPCSVCGGTGAAGDAEWSASVDQWLFEKGIELRGEVELFLREALIEALGGGGEWVERGELPDGNPVVGGGG